MNMYSIKDLENLTGIKAHTIRMWEKRYSILRPDRSTTNIRMYNESELKKLLNIAYLNRHGFRISDISRMSEIELTEKVLSINTNGLESSGHFQNGNLILSVIRLDEQGLYENLEPLIREKGFEDAYIDFILPFQQKVKLLWQTGTLSRAQEQFLVSFVRQKILVEEHQLPQKVGTKGKSFAIFTHLPNQNEHNVLFFKYLIRKHGFRAIYTGGNIPASDIAEIHKIQPFDYLLIYSDQVLPDTRNMDYLSRLAQSLKLKKVLFTENDYSKSPNMKNITAVRDPKHFRTLLKEMV